MEEYWEWQAKLPEDVWAAYSNAKGVERVKIPGQNARYELQMPNKIPFIVQEEETCSLLFTQAMLSNIETKSLYID